MIGAMDTRQVIYDVNRDLVVGQIGDSAIFPDPEGDIALSPQGDWFVNGHKDKDQKKNFKLLSTLRWKANPITGFRHREMDLR